MIEITRRWNNDSSITTISRRYQHGKTAVESRSFFKVYIETVTWEIDNLLVEHSIEWQERNFKYFKVNFSMVQRNVTIVLNKITSEQSSKPLSVNINIK